MPTKFKIFAIAAALAAGTSSAAMASIGYRLPDTCTAGYFYYNGLCQRVPPPPPGCGNPVTGTGTANTLTGGSTPPAACPCGAGSVFSAAGPRCKQGSASAVPEAS
jgi:hypothetical protein